MSLEIFCRGGWVVKSLANRQLSTRAGSHAQKIFADDETGGEGVKTGRKPSKTAGLNDTAQRAAFRMKLGSNFSLLQITR